MASEFFTDDNFYQRKNGQILGLGLTVSPANSDFSRAILAGLKTLRTSETGQ